MLSIRGLNVAIRNVQILREVSLELPQGSMTGLIGRNGAGKTTLMKSLMGILKAASGSVRFGDTDLLALATHKRARLGIGYMPEDRRLIPELTIEENILVPAWASGLRDARARLEKIYEYVPELTAEENILAPAWAARAPDAAARLQKAYTLVPEAREFAQRKGSQLSGGQQKLVALARALVSGTKLLLLDEPFEGVAPALAQRLAEVVAGLKKDGMSVILSESDLQHSERLVDRVYVIDRGSVSLKER